SALALAGSLALMAQPALAQDRDAENTKAEQDATDTVAKSANDRAALISGQAVRTDDSSGEIIVTGTRINRPNTFSAAPITSVTVQDIQAQAPLNVEEVLN